MLKDEALIPHHEICLHSYLISFFIIYQILSSILIWAMKLLCPWCNPMCGNLIFCFPELSLSLQANYCFQLCPQWSLITADSLEHINTEKQKSFWCQMSLWSIVAWSTCLNHAFVLFEGLRLCLRAQIFAQRWGTGWWNDAFRQMALWVMSVSLTVVLCWITLRASKLKFPKFEL